MAILTMVISFFDLIMFWLILGLINFWVKGCPHYPLLTYRCWRLCEFWSKPTLSFVNSGDKEILSNILNHDSLWGRLCDIQELTNIFPLFVIFVKSWNCSWHLFWQGFEFCKMCKQVTRINRDKKLNHNYIL